MTTATTWGEMTPFPLNLIVCDNCGASILDEDDRQWLNVSPGTTKVAAHTDAVLCDLLAVEHGRAASFDTGDYGPRIPKEDDHGDS